MIEVNNLSFTYSGSSSEVLKKLNFKIREGEIFGFLGPSGAGKSTTQKILYKTLHDYSGSIIINKKPLSKWGKEYFEKIGVGFELPNHYLNLTARENLELFGAFYPKNKLIKKEVLTSLVGLEDSIDKKVSEFSKGMKMRLNFIRAIMHDPDILFFDEPTAGLDPMNSHKIKEHILLLKNLGKTIFITTHNMTTADEICDRVSFIVDGKLRVTDEPSTLKHQHGRRLVRVELKNSKMAEFPLKNLGSNQDFIAFMNKDEIIRINTEEATLEEVFIHVTGKTLKT